jgi:hypothetical protein
MHFGELKKRFMTTAPIHILWYIRNILDCLEVSKCVFILNIIYIRVPLFVSKAITTQIWINLPYWRRLHEGFFVWYINMVLILRTQCVEKSLLESSRFNLSTDFGGVLKTHFGKLKMRFIPTAPIHIVCYIQNFFDSLQVRKCVFIWNMFYIRVPRICFKGYFHPNFYQLSRL